MKSPNIIVITNNGERPILEHEFFDFKSITVTIGLSWTPFKFLITSQSDLIQNFRFSLFCNVKHYFFFSLIVVNNLISHLKKKKTGTLLITGTVLNTEKFLYFPFIKWSIINLLYNWSIIILKRELSKEFFGLLYSLFLVLSQLLLI